MAPNSEAELEVRGARSDPVSAELEVRGGQARDRSDPMSAAPRRAEEEVHLGAARM